MKRITLWATTIAVLLWLSGMPLLAQGRGGGGGMGGGAGMGARTGSMGDQGHGMGNGPTEGRGPGMENAGRDTGQNQGNNHSTTGGQRTPGELLTQNTKLSSKLQPLLPGGTDLQSAASGFKNLGQFVAAVHVSHNLNIPFDQLKDKVVSSGNLGKAIHELNPNLSNKEAKSEARKAEKAAKQEIKESKS